jgi:hypothetical protein
MFKILPDEIFMEIMEYLVPSTLLKVRRCSKSFKYLISDKFISSMLTEFYGYTPSENDRIQDTVKWFESDITLGFIKKFQNESYGGIGFGEPEFVGNFISDKNSVITIHNIHKLSSKIIQKWLHATSRGVFTGENINDGINTYNFTEHGIPHISGNLIRVRDNVYDIINRKIVHTFTNHLVPIFASLEYGAFTEGFHEYVYNLKTWKHKIFDFKIIGICKNIMAYTVDSKYSIRNLDTDKFIHVPGKIHSVSAMFVLISKDSKFAIYKISDDLNLEKITDIKDISNIDDIKVSLTLTAVKHSNIIEFIISNELNEVFKFSMTGRLIGKMEFSITCYKPPIILSYDRVAFQITHTHSILKSFNALENKKDLISDDTL